jgi:hypothetical protein
LTAVLGNDVLGVPQKKITVDGEKIELTDELYEEYAKLAGTWIKEDIAEEMATKEWSTYSDEDKIEIIKEIAKDARKDARTELFSGTPE